MVELIGRLRAELERLDRERAALEAALRVVEREARRAPPLAPPADCEAPPRRAAAPLRAVTRRRRDGPHLPIGVQRQKLIAFLRVNGPARRKDLTDRAGIPASTVNILLNEAGLFRKDDNLWHLADDEGCAPLGRREAANGAT